MPTITYNEESFSCTKAVKGSDYIKLYDGDTLSVLFDGVVDFSAFSITDGTWSEPSGVEEARGDATLSGGKLTINVDGEVGDNTVVKFKAPCACTSVTAGIVIAGKSYSLVDASGNSMVGSAAWASGAAVSLQLDKTNGKAYILNSAVGDSYTKEQNLSAAVKSSMGLGTNAVPSDAFSKLHGMAGIAANTVKDVVTGKLYNIVSMPHSFTTRNIATPFASASCLGYNANGYATTYMRGNILYAFCRTYDSTARNYTLYLVAYNVETNSVVSTKKLYDSLSSSDSSESANYFCSFDCASHDDSVVSCYITGSPAIIDLQHNILYSSGSSTSCVFSTPNYWGYVYINSYKARYLYYAKRGTSTFTMINIGNAVNSSYYDIYVCGTYGDTLIYLDRTGYVNFRTGRINIATGAVTSGLDTCDFNAKFGTTSWGDVRTMLCTGTHAYIAAWFSFNNDSNNYMPNKTIKVDLSTGLTNFSEVTGKVVCPINDLAYSMSSYCYIGSVGTKAYYVQSNYSNSVNVYDKANDSYSTYTLENQVSNMQTRHNAKEAQFDIKDMPGTIPCGFNYFDVNAGAFKLYAVGDKSVSVTSVGIQQASFPLSYPAFQCSNTTDFKCLGFAKVEMTQLVVGPVRRTIQFIEEAST